MNHRVNLKMEKKKTISFKEFSKQFETPFVIYAHIASIQVPSKISETRFVHQPCGFGLSVKSRYDAAYVKYFEYFGEDCVSQMWSTLDGISEEIKNMLKIIKEPKVLNQEEQWQCSKVRNCYICRKAMQNDRHLDFYPWTGELLGVAHLRCASLSKYPKRIPVIFNNLAKYAFNFLKTKQRNFYLVGHRQGFIADCGSLRFSFKDLKQFLVDEKKTVLGEALTDSKKKKLFREFGDFFDIMKKNVCFPFSYVDSFEKFADDVLPSRDGFLDRLSDTPITTEDYDRTSEIWNKFSCGSIEDFFYLYLKSKVFLLEDIFENFRRLCMDNYHLDPCHYFTISSFSWDAMMKYVGEELEVLEDTEMLNFIKRGIRGGINQCSKRHSKANNKYCDYDSSKPSTFIIYLDANNLGGWAMSQFLPYSSFEWLTREAIDSVFENILTLREDGEFGYMLEVDLEYPQDLHLIHNDLAFCVRQMEVKFKGKTVMKPVLDLNDKHDYIIDYRHLKLCLEQGLVLKKVKRVLKYKQKKWLEPYIKYNTDLRAEATNDFEVQLFKRLNNGLFGKTIQKTDKSKPVYAGFAILELSKKFIYDFHYNVMKPKYKELSLLYVDTDGLIYEIQTEDFFKDITSDPEFLDMLDTSDLDSRWGIVSKNKKAVGKMKDEMKGKIVKEFFGVGSKVYFLDVENIEIKKAVGMPKYVKEKCISKIDYQECVLEDKTISRFYMETFTDSEGQVVSRRQKKVVLSPGDSKRKISEDKSTTYSLGFKKRRS